MSLQGRVPLKPMSLAMGEKCLHRDAVDQDRLLTWDQEGHGQCCHLLVRGGH